MNAARNALAIACAFLAIFLNGCADHSVATNTYLIELRRIEIDIDNFEGNLTAVKGIPERLSKLMEQEPQLPQAYAAAAHFLIFVGSADGWPGRDKNAAKAAESFLNDAQRSDPSYCEIHWLRAQLFLVQKDVEAAWIPINEAKRLRCVDPWLNIVAGNAFIATNQIDEAEAEFRKVLDAGPGPASHSQSAYSAAATYFGMMLYGLDRFDDLRHLLDEWDAAGQVFATWGNVNASRQRLLIGDFEKSERLAQTAMTALDFPAARGARGVALYAKAWAAKISGDSARAAEAEKTEMLAREYLSDEAQAIKVLSKAPCCTSEAWQALLAARTKAHAAEAAPTPPGKTPP